MIKSNEYDVVVVGSGPNGLAAAIKMQMEGLSVLLVEAKGTIGGGMRTAELTLPGFHHDICSAIHPLAAESPFFKKLPLHEHGLEFIYPEIAAAHPLDNGNVAILTNSIDATAESLGADYKNYTALIEPLVKEWHDIVNDVLSPLKIPSRPFKFIDFGLKALQSAKALSGRFRTQEGKGLWAGMAAHSIQPLTNLTTSAIGLVLMTVAHTKGWPIPRGGSQSLANALGAYFQSLGGQIETDYFVKNIEELPPAKAILLDVTPKQLLQIAGDKFSNLYKWQLGKYRYGMGVFKVDWALDGPIPFKSESCQKAGTVHLGNTFEEIATSERLTSKGVHPERPFVLLSQQSRLDATRAPLGKHTAWGYCHVPNGSITDMTHAIEDQVERFAPGFKKRIIARHTFNTQEIEAYNPNYIGGDINGGLIDITQLFTRPALRLSSYRTSAKGIYLCSSSTPPGGGVHGMCGFHAANRALQDIFY